MATADTARRPDDTEHAPYYARYVEQVPAGDVLAQLRDGGRALHAALASLSPERAGVRYAAAKWSVREVVGHITDAERVFAYRALRIARGDETPLASFDENAYVAAAGADARPLADLLEEQRSVRDATVRLFASLPEAAWVRRGTASGQPVSVRALAFIIAGHAIHHLAILHERYGVPRGA